MTVYTGTGTPASVSTPSADWTFLQLYTRFAQQMYDTPTDAEWVLAKQYINDGYLRFLGDHEWSFLTKIANVTITATSSGKDALATDFDALVGDPVLSIGDSNAFGRRLYERPYVWIANKRQLTANATGQPAYYAVAPATFVTATGQRWELHTYPLPDADYVVSLQYRYRPTMMADDTDHPVAGSIHCLSILEAALMLSEQNKGRSGHHTDLYYNTHLPMSIERDRALKPNILGSTPASQIVAGARPTFSYITE